MPYDAAHRSGPTRALVAAAVAVALAAATPAAAAAAASASGPAGSAPTASSLQVEAQELAGQIQSEGRDLDQLSEQLDAARIEDQQLDAELDRLHMAMASTARTVRADRSALKQQALLAYLTGGAPLVDNIPLARAGTDPSLAVSYAEIVSGGEQRAVDAYQAALSAQLQQAQQLGTARQEAAVTLADLQADRAAAAQTFAERQATLAQVKGQLAVLVAQVQANQQRAEQAAVQANLAHQGQLPPATPAVRPAPPPAPASTTTAVAARPGPPAPTTHPPAPTTAAPTTDPPTTSSPPTTSPPPTTPPAPPPGNTPAPGWQLAVNYAYAQLGKPYQWGGAGPNSFDCSGLVMMAWETAGVYFPHLAQDQYDLTRRIPLADALPGDLIFYGTPTDVYHVGIYIGGGQMIDAPETGQDVSISSIYWAGLLGAGRVDS